MVSHPCNNFDLELGQKSRSRHGVNWKGLSQGSCMPYFNALSLILQKIWARLKFLWQMDKWVLMSPAFVKGGGTITILFFGKSKAFIITGAFSNFHSNSTWNGKKLQGSLYRISGYFGVGKFWRICSEISIGNFGASFKPMRQNFLMLRILPYCYFWIVLAEFITFHYPQMKNYYINTSLYTEVDNC